MRLKYIGTNFKSYATLCGSLRFNRAILRPETDDDLKRFKELVGEGRTTYHPMDSLLGVENIPFLMSAGLLSAVVYELIRGDGSEAHLKRVRNKYKESGYSSQPERYIAYAGACAYRHQAAEAARAKRESLTHGGAGAHKGAPAKRLYLYIGSAGRLVYRDKAGEKGAESVPCHFAVAFRDDDAEYLRDKEGELRGFRTRRRDMVAVLDDERDAAWHIRALADRSGYCDAARGGEERTRGTELVVLSDGSEWAIRAVKEAFGPAADVTFILERERFMDDAAKLIHFHIYDGKRASEHIRRLSRALDAGDGEAALEIFRPWRFLKRPEVIPDVFKVLEENREHINYGEYIKRDIFIGTGLRDCSDVRLSELPDILSGGVSLKESARGLLSLLALRESGRWEELVYMLEKGGDTA